MREGKASTTAKMVAFWRTSPTAARVGPPPPVDTKLRVSRIVVAR